jgi:hypothetical protein
MNWQPPNIKFTMRCWKDSPDGDATVSFEAQLRWPWRDAETNPLIRLVVLSGQLSMQHLLRQAADIQSGLGNHFAATTIGRTN